MNYLAIDTSGDLLVLLKYNGKKTVRRLVGSQTKHSLTLMPYIEEVLEESGASLNDLDFFACVVGPGSFTGIRIGVATVKALCLATQKPALSVTAFDILAYSNNAPSNVFCVVDANHDNYYSCAYANKEIAIQPCFLTKEEVLEKSKDYTVCSITACGFENCYIADVLSGLENAIDAKTAQVGDYNKVVPLYVKRSQAEEESC